MITLASASDPPPTYPENLFSRDASEERRWWVARTKSRQEKALAWDLQAKSLSYHLPLVRRPQKSRKRMRTSVVPLFSGYVFFKATSEESREAYKTGRVAQVLSVVNQDGLERELSMLARAAEQRCQLELCDFMQRGQKVKIIDGPLEGFEGVIWRKKNKQRLVLQVEAIRQATAVEIDLDQVQVV